MNRVHPRRLLDVAVGGLGLPAVATAYLRAELHSSTQARAAGLSIGGTALCGMAGRLLTGYTAELADGRWALATAASSDRRGLSGLSRPGRRPRSHGPGLGSFQSSPHTGGTTTRRGSR